ncbi:stabilin-1 [Chanos chanos]|uniref:Stabilin-1 n=1 Tax=Chanos chanos TaxID=29144 RepID=A0A6J2VIS2_CHACN|nr:stabilin-1 [Chanos chanos]
MHHLLILVLLVPCSLELESASNRCDVPRTIQISTPCTSCAAATSVICPRGFQKITKDIGNANCSYVVDTGERQLNLLGCTHTCVKVVTERRCCPSFWGPLCLPCPRWSDKVCNWHGTCVDGNLGNGTCVCQEGYTGFACQKCTNENSYGDHCSSRCSCVNGKCNSGPDGNGECYCQPPFSGPKCDKVSSSCSNCTAYSYCKGDPRSAVCECLPGYKKVGHICTGVCSSNVCDVNADCSYKGGGLFQCKCKEGYEGDGKHCTPVNPCAKNNGGCPVNSTVCEYTGPGKSKCVCMSGMEGSDPSAGCTLKSVCTASTCHRNAYCETGQDGIPRCFCDADKIGDGRRCYGNIIERVLELDTEGSHKGKLTGAISLLEGGCELSLNMHGPFTAFVPLLQSPLAVSTIEKCGASGNFLCKHHLILGQRLYRDLESNDLWTYGGAKIRFKMNKQFILMRDPDTLFTIIQSDIPASNGIIHIIDKPITNVPSHTSANPEFSSLTIHDIFAKDGRFNRFLSLVDNCGAPMPLRGPGPLTVFVPTNDAIDRFRDGSVIYMINDAKHKLQEFLRHHMFSTAAVTMEQLASMPAIETMANQVVTINVTGDGRVALSDKGIRIETADIVASNGIIHLIDGVLVPPSILPILPHRCDVNESKIIVGPCVKCSYLYETHCPPGSTELDSHLKNCEASLDQPWSSSLAFKGCAKYCNVTQVRAECCSGFFGPDCKPCLGGFQHPCYDKGTCFDGIDGNGTCKCFPAFTGIACHLCSDPNKHGENCDEDCRCVHGICDNRPGSMGACRRGSCQAGYSGDLCDKTVTPCNSDGAYEHCHIHAYCTYIDSHTTCVCQAGYEGDGHSCNPVNLCLKPGRGGCDSNAQCVYAGPGNVSCVCNEGWTGDGQACVEINNCLLKNRGGCHANAECRHIGPGQSECTCKKGYTGDGTVCDIVNPCLKNNGGCHALANCEFKVGGSHMCKCPEGYRGNGTICYGSIMAALDESSEFYSFNRMMQRHRDIYFSGNVTAVVPSRQAFRNLSASEENFWFDSYRLPYLLKTHFLDGIYSFEDLQQQVNGTVPSKTKTQWKVKAKGQEIMIHDATISIPNIEVIDGYIHVIDKVLKPPISDVPPLPPELMEVLNKTPKFSLFRQAALLYNLSENIPTRDYTVLIPYDTAIEEYLKETNSTQLGEDVLKYHVIIKDQLFPDHLFDGLLKTTLLGDAYQVMFHTNSKNETMVNDVLLDGNFTETYHGVVMGIPRVLDIHKNHCSKDVVLRVSGRCGPCDGAPRCSYGTKPMKDKFPPNMKSNCKYRTRVGRKRKTVTGCLMDCLKQTKDHACCPGYYGHDCFKCPGKVDNWCSNNGKCMDGLFGNGECLCNEGFHGTACETCEPGRYGKDCKSECHCQHGKCLDGIEGNGQCLCYKGWKGVNCSVEIVADACGGVCDENANCIAGDLGVPPTCSCIAGYQGNGTVCKEINLCDADNGGCSKHANCTKISPGERSCTCREGYTGDGVMCLEIDLCLEDNGGCHRNSYCIRTGPNKAACVCKPGFSGNGEYCFPVNPCRKNNGGCSPEALCRSTEPGERNCTCRIGYIGDGFDCRGTISRELLRKPEAQWFRRWSLMSGVRDMYNKGPFTVFVPHADYINNFTQMASWQNASHAEDVIRYHIVGCEELFLSDLKSINSVVAASGHLLNFSVREDVLYINEKAKIITSDYQSTNGVIHFIDQVLSPYDLESKSTKKTSTLNITAAAEAYGYSMVSKLLQETSLLSLLQNPFFHPLTMFWPTDAVFNSFSEERKRWLYSEDHRDKLEAYLKGHIIRDQRIVALGLPHEKFVRTIYGTPLTFSCDKNLVGNILIDGNNAKIVERHMVFDSGIAYGIDQLLEPPNIGARCDGFEETEITGRCGLCLFPPHCQTNSKDTGKTKVCTPLFFSPRRHRFHRPFGFSYGHGFGYDFHDFGYNRPMCQRVCTKMTWLPRCCKNHYGRDCQVCPGGLEAPCGEHGKCDDGKTGTGGCICNPGFKGTACELCKPHYYGSNCTACNCTVHGKCDDGSEGDGSCACEEGWTGSQCESKIEVKPVCSPECHHNAVCLPGNQCECQSPYEGNGYNCTAPDLCSEYNGGCHLMADCLQTDINVTCSCQSGYSGDGYDCSPINKCKEEPNGGCSDFATCTFTGPNERTCECLLGYVGNGIQCLEKVVPPVDRCLEDNGGCDPRAICKDLHFHTKTAGVFHLRSPLGKYKMNFTVAEAACDAEDATLATFSQLSDAQQLGMHLCSAGWMAGMKVGYPIRFPSAKCGDNHVGVVLYKDPVDVSGTYDAYCYRMREVSCECGEDYVGNGEFCNGHLESVVATNSNFSIFYRTLLKYAEATVEGHNLLNFLSTKTSNITMFVPHNDGFSTNETLSWRDVEYHISTNNSIHFYEDLKHDTAIPSRLGYDLSVMILTINKTQTDDAQSQKLVNKRVILAWNIPAINGIIHVIQGPLRAPLVTVKPAPLGSHSSSTTVTSILITILVIGIVAGFAYYVLKYKNDAFRFQYFRNEDDGTSTREGGNPALVSIPNPLYSGYKAFAEPFGDSPEADSPIIPNLLE